jgi:hypothetical protein
MPNQEEVILEEFHPDWKGWIKGILREIDHAERCRIWLTHETLKEADYLEDGTWRRHLRREWPDCLLGHLRNLRASLESEENQIVQRALELTRGLIAEIKKD